MDLRELTPIQKVNDIYLKRDDCFEIYGVKGGKARSAYMLIQEGIKKGYKEFVTAGSRFSPQCEIVSYLCQNLGLKNYLFMPKGKETSVIEHINQNNLSTIFRTNAGYNNVICSHAKKYAEENNCFYIPFGMECQENIGITKHQVQNIPKEVKRIVMPIGSGMSFISVLSGLDYYKMYDKEIIGVSVGKDVTKNLKKYLPCNYFGELFNNIQKIKYTIIKSELAYDTLAPVYNIGNVELDRVYEAKCLPYIKQGDLLWIVGKRK